MDKALKSALNAPLHSPRPDGKSAESVIADNLARVSVPAHRIAKFQGGRGNRGRTLGLQQQRDKWS